MNMIRKIAGLALTVSLIIGCKKEVGPLSDIIPDIPVTVTNAIAYRPDPAVSTSLAGGGNIQIILSIPESSGRTIKEVKIATNTSYSAIQSTGTTGFYTTAPIAASGTTFTFNTTIAQYFVINPLNPISNPAAS